MSLSPCSTRAVAASLCMFTLSAVPTGCASVGGSGTCPPGYARQPEGTCVPAAVESVDALDLPNTPDQSDAYAGDASEVRPDIGVDTLVPSPSGEDATPGQLCTSPPESGELVLVHTNPDGTDGDREVIAYRSTSGSPANVRVDVYDVGGALRHSYSGAEATPGLSEDGSQVHVFGPVDASVYPVGTGFSSGSTTAFPCDRSAGCLLNAGGIYELVTCDDTVLDTVEVPALDNGEALARCGGSTEAPSLVGAGTLGVLESSPEGDMQWVDRDFCVPPCDETLYRSFEFLALLVDPAGADAGNEFVVLQGAPDSAVDGLFLEGVDGVTGRAWLPPVALHGETDASGRFVVGGASVADRHATLPGTLQNGPDGLRLYACGGAFSERIAWGDVTAPELHDVETQLDDVASGVAQFHCGGGYWLATTAEDALEHTDCEAR